MTVEPAPDSAPAHPGREAPILQLQELDLSIDRLTTRQAALESKEDIRAARERTEDAERRVGDLRLSVDEVDREQGRLEGDIDSIERKIEAERKRLFDGSVVNSKELQSIEAEITSLTHRRSGKEDRVLELMERREELDARMMPVEADLADARERTAEIEQSSGRELLEIRRALAERESERHALLTQIDPELLDLYEDLRRQKKGIGAASIVDGICQGCHQKLSPMYVDRLKNSQGVWRCEYCRRILVPV